MKNCNDTYTKNLLKQFLPFELFNSHHALIVTLKFLNFDFIIFCFTNSYISNQPHLNYCIGQYD